MLVERTFLQLIFWVNAAYAFFPWIPEHSCGAEDASCQAQSQRRGMLSGAVTLPLSQRPRDRSEPESETVSRSARQLSRKFERPLPFRSPDLARRQNNQYKVVRASAPTIADAAAVHQDGTDLSYFVDVAFGSSPKSVYMLFDTGAGTTWVMGSSCSTAPCKAHNSFGPTDSKTFQSTSKPFSITYGTGSVSGELVTDTVVFAGKSISMTFGLANFTSEDFGFFPFDGILGMSMASGATDNLLEVFKKEKEFTNNVFAVALHRSSDGPNTGEVSFGGANPAKYTGAITYADVSDKAGGDWAIPLDDFAYDGNKAGVKDRLAYIDTGTTYMFGPPSDLALVHKQIPGAKSTDGITYTAPCDSTKNLTVSFAGVGYTISRKDWLSAPSESGQCTSNLYGHEVVKGAWLLGDAFLKNVYAVFDKDQTRIGFATRPVVIPPVPTTSPAQTSSSPSSSQSSPGAATTPLSSTSTTTSGPRGPSLSVPETSTDNAAAAATTPPTSSAGQLQIGGCLISLSLFVAAAIVAMY